MKTKPKSLGQIAYEADCSRCLPPEVYWDELSKGSRRAWQYIATSVAHEVNKRGNARVKKLLGGTKK